MAGARGWVVFMKDTRVRYNPAERETVKASRVRCFCLSNQNLSAADMANRFVDNLGAIVAACAADGPVIYAVHRHRIERLLIGDK